MTRSCRAAAALAHAVAGWSAASLVGWLVVYNVMRIGGSNPAAGRAAGARHRRGRGRGRVRRWACWCCAGSTPRAACCAPARSRSPRPSEMEPAQRDAVALAWPAARRCSRSWRSRWAPTWRSNWLGADARGLDHRSSWRRGTSWSGLWLGDEALRLRRGEAEGIESIVLGCGLTAVLAGVGPLARPRRAGGQMVLIVLAGVAGVPGRAWRSGACTARAGCRSARSASSPWRRSR